MKLRFVLIPLFASCVINAKAQVFQVDRIANTGSNSFLEGYRAFASQDGLATGLMGVNHVWNLNRKLSVVYGVSYSNFLFKGFDHERPAIISGYRLNAPIELRYYVIPRENKVTSYLFCNYNNLLTYKGSNINSTPKINLGLCVQTYVGGSSSVSFRTSFSTGPSKIY